MEAQLSFKDFKILKILKGAPPLQNLIEGLLN